MRRRRFIPVEAKETERKNHIRFPGLQYCYYCYNNNIVSKFWIVHKDILFARFSFHLAHQFFFGFLSLIVRRMFNCEAIGSVPRTSKLQAALQSGDAEALSAAQLEALEETISTLKSISAGNPICDGEQVMKSARYFFISESFSRTSLRPNRASPHIQSLGSSR